ncbi:MAG: hypothetical protein ACK4UN_19745 [Limisphaerales bacterium]
MRIARFRAFAEYRNFVITDRFDYAADIPDFTEESSRRGFLVHRPNIVYHNIWNEHWCFALSIEFQDRPPDDFGDAERVIHLPVELSGPMLLHGSTDWEESTFRRLPLGAGRYSVFSKGWNLGQESLSDEAEQADDETYWGVADVERYEWIICPMVKSQSYVVRGKEFMY